MPPTDRLVVFRSALLSYSETFILAQAENLAAYSPVFIGAVPVKGLTGPGPGFQWAYSAEKKGRSLAWFSALGIASPKIETLIRAQNPAVIHAHFVDGGLLAGPVGRRLGVPVVTTCHGVDVTQRERLRHRLRNQMVGNRGMRELQRTGTLFVAVSRYIRGAMIERGFPEERIRLHYIGVDLEKFKPEGEERQPVVLFVGRLVEKKGCRDLAMAMLSVWKHCPEARLVIIGSGSEKKAVEQILSGHENKVQFIGVAGSGEVRDWMARASILCAPSVRAANGDSEGLPMVICEAQAMELPVVTTFHSGIPEAVLDGNTGLLCPEKTPECLAIHLVDLLKNPAKGRAMGKEARKRMGEHFNLRTQNRALEMIYNEAREIHGTRHAGDS